MRRLFVALAGIVLAGSAAAAQPLEGRLKTVRDAATLRIAYRTDSPPFSFLDPQGRPTGYSIELCQRIAKSLERELGVADLKIQWVQVDARTRFDAIAKGSADLECGSTTVSLSRLKIVDFSSLIFAESTGVMVRQDSSIKRFDEMAGKKIGVVPDSTNARAVRRQLDQRRINATLVDYRDREQGVAAVANGAIDGFATDKIVLLSLAQAANLRDVVLLPDDLSFEPFAIVLPRQDPDFRLAVNAGLAQVFRSGDIIGIYSKYFSGLAPRPSVWLGAVFIFGALPE